MTSSLFDQPFVHCGVCHRTSSSDDPLYLTSCAHTLCSQHMDVKVCPVCHISDVLVIKLAETKQLPDEIKILFQPIPNLLENLHNVAQFQITGLVNQCRHYQDLCCNLREKCGRQRQLLFQAKKELDSVAQLKSRILELESLLRSSSSSSSVFSSHRAHKRTPDTVDFTFEKRPSDQEESFIEKLKTTSALKNKKPAVNLPTSSDNSLSSTGAIAESTQLDKFRFSPDVLCRPKAGIQESKITVPPNQAQFPSALNKLQIIKRNHTFNNANTHKSISTKGSQGLLSHVRSSNNGSSGSSGSSGSMRAQTQTGLLMRRNTASKRPIGAFQGNNKLKRVR